MSRSLKRSSAGRFLRTAALALCVLISAAGAGMLLEKAAPDLRAQPAVGILLQYLVLLFLCVILEKEVEYVYKRNSSKSKIGVEAARKKVSAFSGISLTRIKSGTCRYEYDAEDREGTYTVRFRSGNYRYEYEVLAPTGVIIEYSREYVGKNR